LALKFLTIENGDVKLHLLFSRAQWVVMLKRGSVTVVLIMVTGLY